MTIYAGEIIEKRTGSYGDDGNAVCNLVIGTTKKVFGGIETMVKKTVVLFKKSAELADAKLSEGDRVYFDSVIRNPRIYKTKRGADVETVDMIADSFTKITKAQLEKGLKAEASLMMSEVDFKFTDADREMLANLSTTSDSDSDVDSTFV